MQWNRGLTNGNGGDVWGFEQYNDCSNEEIHLMETSSMQWHPECMERSSNTEIEQRTNEVTMKVLEVGSE